MYSGLFVYSIKSKQTYLNKKYIFQSMHEKNNIQQINRPSKVQQNQ